MGFLKCIRQQIQSMKDVRRSIQEYAQEQEQYLHLTAEEFLALPADAQYEATRTRLWDKAESCKDIRSAMDVLTSAQRAVYAATYYEMEVNNGGLCQYFVNSSRYTAPYLSGALEILGAWEHKDHFDRFIAENHIDLQDLSSFAIKRSSEFVKQLERYPFESFDDAFYRMPPIEEAAKAYVVAHLQEFLHI